MDDDLSAIASFNKTYPLDFKLYEGEDKESVIFIENGTRGQELTLEIFNHSDRPISFPNKSGKVSADNHHFELRFRPDTLSQDSLQQLVLAEKKGWSMSRPVTQVDRTVDSPVTQADGIAVSLYFIATNNQTLAANSTATLTLQHINGAAAGGARTTRVELRCPQFTYHGELFHHYYREKRLSIISHRGKKHIPLHVGFLRSNRILNDWNPEKKEGSTNELILRITNVLKDEFISFKPASKGDEASKFIISFDIDSDWALGTKSEVENINDIKVTDWRPNEKPEEDWNTVKNTEGETPTWTITHKNIHHNQDKAQKEPGLAPGQVVQLTISNIKSSLPSGHANLYVRYENIPGYWDGTFVCTIEKSPILYKEGNVGIGTTTPQAKLSINGGLHVGGDSDPGDNNLLVDGKTTTNQLVVNPTPTTEPGDNNLLVNGKTTTNQLSVNETTTTNQLSVNETTTTNQLSVNETTTNQLSVTGSLNFGSSTRQMINLWDNTFGIGIQSNTQYFRTAGNFAWYVGGNHDDGLLEAGGGSVPMVINSLGNVGIGVTNPGQKLVVSSTSNTGKQAESGMQFGGSLAIVSNAPQIDFINTQHKDWSILVNSDKMYFIREPWNYQDLVLDGKGNVGIGTDSPEAKLEVRGDLRISNGTNWVKMYIDDVGDYGQNLIFQIKDHKRGTGMMRWDGDSNWDSVSDLSLKTDIENEGNILSRLMQLDVKNYRWKHNLTATTKKIGFVAQDVQPLFPSLVGEFKDKDADESTLTLKYAEFGVLAVGGLKELKLEKDAEIAKLKSEMNTQIAKIKTEMEAEINALKKQIQQLLRGKE
ncbi:MAG: hypothetical protein F6K34_11665 [Okeania sp. SIO4D6]|nr:hypothetical protein [Okeania sp. SIO4D6]